MTFRGAGSGRRSRKIAALLSFLLGVVAGCATPTEITLPALDASKTMMAEALVVETDHSRGSDAPSGVVRGAGEGAANAMGEYLGTVQYGDAGVLWLLLMPVALPVSAVVGAAMAHSEEEVEAAIAAYNRVGRDEEFLASIDRRFIQALGGEAAKRWTCVAAVTTETQEPCPGFTPITRLKLRPSFTLQTDGDYDPDIHFSGNVVALVSVVDAGFNATPDVVLEAKWAYREELGTFFALVENDATPLRRKLDDILDRFATRIAEDLYLTPRPETIVRKEEYTGRSFTELPQGVVVRVEQGSDLFSRATHGWVSAKDYSFYEPCWVDSVEGKPTGHSNATLKINRGVAVKAGRAQIVVSCIIDRWSIDAKVEHHNMELLVEPGAAYVTDGRTYERL